MLQTLIAIRGEQKREKGQEHYARKFSSNIVFGKIRATVGKIYVNILIFTTVLSRRS